MFFYLYEIKNNINNKIYVGVHKTSNLEDGYMGSGKIIKNAIKKYGIQNFTKRIIESFSSEEEMFKREKEIVNEDFLNRDDVYNLRRGGTGGFDYINSSGLVKFKGKKHKDSSKLLMGHPNNKNWLGKKHTEETKKLISNKLKGYKRSQESIEKQDRKSTRLNSSH